MERKDSELRYHICSLSAQAVRKLICFYNRALEPAGLTAQQVMALGVLWRGGEMSLGEFAKKAGMGKAAAVAMINRLEKMKLITKATDPTDARLNVIKLTDTAVKRAPELLAGIAELEKKIEAAVGESDMEVLVRSLKLIRDMDF